MGGDDGEFHTNRGAFVEKERDDGEFEGRSRFLWGLPSVSEIFWAMNPVPFPSCVSVSGSDLSVFLCLSISHTDRYTRTNTHKHPTDQNKHAHTRKNTHPHQRKYPHTYTSPGMYDANAVRNALIRLRPQLSSTSAETGCVHNSLAKSVCLARLPRSHGCLSMSRCLRMALMLFHGRGRL